MYVMSHEHMTFSSDYFYKISEQLFGVSARPVLIPK
jgi:hypothetical protein